MEEIDVIKNLIESDFFNNVDKVDGMIGNRPISTTKEYLREEGISDDTIKEIEFFSHMHSNNSVDILGTSMKDERIGVEAKGVAPSKEKTKSNLKYWSKGIFNQTAEIHDTMNCDLVGFAIPENVGDLFRGVISSFDKEPDWSDVQNQEAEELYGSKQVEIIENFKQDRVLLVGRGNVQIYTVEEFFGL